MIELKTYRRSKKKSSPVMKKVRKKEDLEMMRMVEKGNMVEKKKKESTIENEKAKETTIEIDMANVKMIITDMTVVDDGTAMKHRN